jgi:hypothetical protein
LKPKKDLLDKQRVYKTPCECGGEYNGETITPLGTRLKGHKYNLRLGNVEKPKVDTHAIEEGHRIV